MNFDERIDRLTERHEALTQTVELLARQVQDVAKQLHDVSGIVTDIAEGTARLLNVAENHERRLDRLEGGGHT